jgi:hypothetical protein
MTTNKTQKKIIRDRMEATGEKYMEARRRTLANRPYTVTVISYEENPTFAFGDKPGSWQDNGVRISAKLTGALAQVFHTEYDTRDYRDQQIGWILIKENPTEYFTNTSDTSQRMKQHSHGRNLIIEYLNNPTPEELINQVIPNTDNIIFHDKATEDNPHGEALERTLNSLTAETRNTLNQKTLLHIIENENKPALRHTENGTTINVPAYTDTLEPYPLMNKAAEIIHATWRARN